MPKRRRLKLSPLRCLQGLLLVAAIVERVHDVVVAREAIRPVLLDLARDPAQVAAPERLPGPGLALDGHIRVHTLALLGVPEPHRVALEAAIGAVEVLVEVD